MKNARSVKAAPCVASGEATAFIEYSKNVGTQMMSQGGSKEHVSSSDKDQPKRLDKANTTEATRSSLKSKTHDNSTCSNFQNEIKTAKKHF